MLTAAKFFSQFWSLLCYSQHHDNYHMITVAIHWTKFKLADHASVINTTKRCTEHVQCQNTNFDLECAIQNVIRL